MRRSATRRRGTPTPGRSSAAWAERAAAVLPGGNTRSVLHFDPFPFRVERAEGRYLYDVDRHRYVDLLGNYTAGLLGHSPPAVRAAAHAAIDGGWALGSVHPNEALLGELIVGRFPSIEQVRFTNSGTEANLMALALAIHHTGRPKVMAFRDGYHGGVLTFGHGGEAVTVPHDWVMADYNDVDGVVAAFAAHGDHLAAVLVEPLQGSAGCIPGHPEFLQALRDLCDRHGTVLVFDEVMTSRLSPGGAQQVLGITPDLTTLGKYLAGGIHVRRLRRTPRFDGPLRRLDRRRARPRRHVQQQRRVDGGGDRDTCPRCSRRRCSKPSTPAATGSGRGSGTCSPHTACRCA